MDENMEGQATESATSGEVQPEVGSEAVTQEGQAQGEQAPNQEGQQPGESDLEIIEQDGKKLIPYDRFKQVIDQKNDLSSFLNQIKNDPAKRQEFLSALNELQGQQKAPETTQGQDTNKAEALTPFAKFLSESVDPQYHAHYTGYAQAIVAEAKEYIDSVVNPLVNYIGESKIKEVRGKISDFDNYENAVLDTMRENPNLTPEQAYKLVSYDDMVKKSQTTAASKEVARKQAMNKAPITKTGQPAGAVAGQKEKGIEAAFNRAWEQNRK